METEKGLNWAKDLWRWQIYYTYLNVFTQFVRDQSEIQTSDFLNDTKGPSGANDAIHPSQMDGGGYWQQSGNWLLTPWAIFLAESHPQQANTTGKQWPAIKRKLLPTKGKKNGTYWAFPIQGWRTTVGERNIAAAKSHRAVVQQFSITN